VESGEQVVVCSCTLDVVVENCIEMVVCQKSITRTDKVSFRPRFRRSTLLTMMCDVDGNLTGRGRNLGNYQAKGKLFQLWGKWKTGRRRWKEDK
jgi:hypothetical protein